MSEFFFFFFFFSVAKIVVFLGFLKNFFGYFWEWLVHERLRLKLFLAYKLSLRDSIFKWTPRGKNATSDMIIP